MTIIEKTDNKLTIPVGIGVIQTETVRNFYNTSDATATANDILVDKVAYGKYGKLTGTLDLNNEKEISYQDGYETGKTDGYYSGYDIGYGNGYTEGETNGYNNGYNTGVADGVVEGKNEIIEGQNDATITPQNVLRGYVGYGKDNERIVGESEAITSIDVGASGIKFGYSSFTEIPSYYDFNNVNSMYYMFYSCSSLTTVPQLNTSNVTNMSYMFYGCSNLTSVPLFDTSNVTNMSYMFYDCSNLTSVPLFDTSNVTNIERMFYDCSNLTSVPLFDTSNVTNIERMFYGCSNLTSVPLFDTSNVTNMHRMFYNCNALTSVPLFDTSNVTNMHRMFYNCNALTSVPLFDTSNVTNMNEVFYGCSSLTSVPEFDLSGMNGGISNCTQIFGTSNYVIDFGGFKDLGKAYQNSNNSYRDVLLQSQSKLSYQSCMNVINKVYDLTLKPDYTYTPKIRFNATPYALLSADDIAIATSKGWVVQAG